MDEATAKKHAADRWGRNLRSVQRYVREHKENIAEALELIWLVPDMNLQEFAHRYRLQDNEAQQFISYFSGPPKPPPEWGISEAGPDAQLTVRSISLTGHDN